MIIRAPAIICGLRILAVAHATADRPWSAKRVDWPITSGVDQKMEAVEIVQAVGAARYTAGLLAEASGSTVRHAICADWKFAE